MVSGSRAWLSTAAGVSPILASPIQKAFAALKRSGTWTVIFSLAGISSGSNHAVRTFHGLADNRFGFQVLLQPEDPAFPTDPRLFEPTEGSKRIVTYRVDQDAAGGELSRHTIGPFR